MQCVVRCVAVVCCLAVTWCWGYTIDTCGNNNKLQVEENTTVNLTCSGITHGIVVWRLTGQNRTIQIGTCYTQSGRCNTTDNNTYLLIRPQYTTSVLTVTADLRNTIAGTVQCAGLSSGNTGGSATCDVRVVYTNYTVTNCTHSVTKTTANWTVSGSCDVDKIYDSDGLYGCSWQHIPEIGAPTKTRGKMTLLPFNDSSGQEYNRAQCSLSNHPMTSTEGDQSYRISIEPKENSNNNDYQSGFDLLSPTAPPVLHHCPHTVTQGDDVSCTCQASPSDPPALVTWSNSTFAVSNVSVLPLNSISQGLHVYTCSQYWGGFSTDHVKTTTYTLNVKYPPASSPLITGITNITEGDTLNLTCTVTGGNPPVTSVTFYCVNHGDENDTITTGDRVRVVTSAVTVNSLTTTDSGIVCQCSAVGGGSLPTSSVTITVHATQTIITTIPTVPASDTSSDGGKEQMHGDDDDDDDDNGVPVAYIAGGVGGLVAVVILVVVICVVIKRRRKGQKKSEEPKTQDSEDDDVFEERTNPTYESVDDTGPPQAKPSAVALRIPAGGRTVLDDGLDEGYTTISSQHFRSSAPYGNNTDNTDNGQLYSSADEPADDFNPGVEMDTYSSVDPVDDGGDDGGADTGLSSSADGPTDSPRFAVSTDTHHDPNAYTVVNKPGSQTTPVPQNNEYAVVNKRRAGSRPEGESSSGGLPENSSSQNVYTEVNKKSKGSKPAPQQPQQAEAALYTQVKKPSANARPGAPAPRPKPTVAAKPSVPVKPQPAGNGDGKPQQGRPPITSDYEEVDLPDEPTTNPVTSPNEAEDVYNRLTHSVRSPTELSGDPECQYSHIGAVDADRAGMTS